MAYIWINPVTAGMYEEEELNVFLQEHGYKRFETSIDWLTIVKDKYLTAVKQSKHPVIDVRCPKAKELLEGMELKSEVTFPQIYPILIHCAQEGSGRKELQNETKIITTPCQALADMGNRLHFPDTHFVSWNQFLEMIEGEPERKQIYKSPIPPGYFKDLDIQTISVTGEEEIRNFFQTDIPEGIRLVELLYCKDGCHHGDGIMVRKSDEFDSRYGK